MTIDVAHAHGRDHALARLITAATTRGGNAIVATRFDTTDLGAIWSKLCAYGTAAVSAVPLSDAARCTRTAHQLGYGQPPTSTTAT